MLHRSAHYTRLTGIACLALVACCPGADEQKARQDAEWRQSAAEEQARLAAMQRDAKAETERRRAADLAQFYGAGSESENATATYSPPSLSGLDINSPTTPTSRADTVTFRAVGVGSPPSSAPHP